MEIFRLYMRIISTFGMIFFGVVMIATGVNNIKRQLFDYKFVSEMSSANGIAVIGLAISQWFW